VSSAPAITRSPAFFSLTGAPPTDFCALALCSGSAAPCGASNAVSVSTSLHLCPPSSSLSRLGSDVLFAPAYSVQMACRRDVLVLNSRIRVSGINERPPPLLTLIKPAPTRQLLHATQNKTNSKHTQTKQRNPVKLLRRNTSTAQSAMLRTESDEHGFWLGRGLSEQRRIPPSSTIEPPTILLRLITPPQSCAPI